MRLHSEGAATGGVVAGCGDVRAIQRMRLAFARFKKWEIHMNRLLASRVSGCLLSIPIAAGAVAASAAGAAGAVDAVGAAGPKAAANEGSQASATLETIVVTGS